MTRAEKERIATLEATVAGIAAAVAEVRADIKELLANSNRRLGAEHAGSRYSARTLAWAGSAMTLISGGLGAAATALVARAFH